jgi:hypothetical protein
MKGKYLITTDNWFIAPDGKQYRAAWGNVEILEDDIMGVKTNRNSTNWFAKVGSDTNHIIIAGCQIHYAVKSNYQPNTKNVMDWNSDASNGIKVFDRPTSIYIAE